MSSNWSCQRRQKRKYSSHLDGGTSISNVSHVCSPQSRSPNTGMQVSMYKESCPAESDDTILDGEDSLSNCASSFEAEEEKPIPSSDEVSKSGSVQSQLKDWAINHQIHHSALNDLPKILKCHYDPSLPSDPRTLCRTPSNISHQIRKISGGEYFHFGLTNCVNE